MKLALSVLCEHPGRKTGLTTLFHEFVSHALPLFPEIDWVVYVGPTQEWTVHSPRVEVVRDYPANDRLGARLLADHFRVPADARCRGAAALLTVGFVPLRKCLPTVMQLFSLQHLDRTNRVGLARRVYRGLIVDRSVHQADLIITNSECAAGQIRQGYPEVTGRMLVSHEGLQHDQFFPTTPEADEGSRVREKFGVSPGYLLWTSNFYAYKQADKLLAAYAQLPVPLRQQRPLVMVGGNWEGGLDQARAQAEALGLAADVHFLGWVDDTDLAPLYRQARGFVLASREETFGRCIAEAMACGTPCVVNDIPIMHEVTGGHALIVDFADSPAATDALTTLCTDDRRHAQLRTDGICWAKQFNFDKLASQRIAAICALLTKLQEKRD